MIITQRHATRSLLSSDRAVLVDVLHESNRWSRWDSTHFGEPRKAAEDRDQTLLSVIFGLVADNEDFVGREVLVWNYAALVGSWFDTLRRAVGKGVGCWTFDRLLCGCESLLALWTPISSSFCICCRRIRAIPRAYLSQPADASYVPPSRLRHPRGQR